jgi:hypothetical protein
VRHRVNGSAVSGSLRVWSETRKLFCQAWPTNRYARVPPGIIVEVRHTRELTDDQYVAATPTVSSDFFMVSSAHFACAPDCGRLLHRIPNLRSGRIVVVGEQSPVTFLRVMAC